MTEDIKKRWSEFEQRINKMKIDAKELIDKMDREIDQILEKLEKFKK